MSLERNIFSNRTVCMSLGVGHVRKKRRLQVIMKQPFLQQPMYRIIRERFLI